MEEVTDTVFRRIMREVGPPDLFFTEFTCTDGLYTAGRPRVIGRFRFTPEERPLIAQIWGNRPELSLRAAAEVRDMGFDGIDLNMGCPVRKVVKRGACGGLIDSPSLAAELIAAAREGAGTLAVSVKTRIGISHSRAEEWIGFLLGQGLSALTVHGRTVAQQSEGLADWGAVALAVRLRDSLGVPTRIVGNGDVKSPAQFLQRVRETGADGIMVGRGVFENIFLFRAIRQSMADGHAQGSEFAHLASHQKIDFFRRHLRLHLETWGPGKSFHTLKKFAKTYLRAFEGAGALIEGVLKSCTHEAAMAVLDSWGSTRAAPSLVGARQGFDEP
jgi:tRNA-dihydrouridine synthase